MSTNTRQLFVIGLPGAGKTTFLAALWHVVESAEIPGSLTLVELRGDNTYLNDLRSQWVDAHELERTKVADETNVSMLLKNPADDTICDLWIPDLSGESFEAQWTDRVAGSDYCNFVRNSIGGIVFIHPNLREEHLISEINDLVPHTNGQPTAIAEPSGNGIPDSSDHEPWNPSMAPTQVQLVDLLQVVQGLVGPRPLRIAVVISAWDLIANAQEPSEWVRERLPLLFQFLSTNADGLNARYFGVSAQGGDFERPDTLNALRSLEKPSQRILVSDGQLQVNDVTLPLRWLMTVEPGTPS